MKVKQIQMGEEMKGKRIEGEVHWAFNLIKNDLDIE